MRTNHTALKSDNIRNSLSDTRRRGIAASFDAIGQVSGTIAVASVVLCFGSASERLIVPAVRNAASEVTTAIGGEVPEEVRPGKEAAA